VAERTHTLDVQSQSFDQALGVHESATPFKMIRSAASARCVATFSAPTVDPVAADGTPTDALARRQLIVGWRT
jgi:hypothetical protein